LPANRRAFLFTQKKCNLTKEDFNLNDYLIAVDGGADFFYQKGLTPKLIIGDLDTISKRALEFFVGKVKIIRYPVHKDYTDTELAFLWCCNNNITNITIVNSLEGRFDHSFALLSLLFLADKKGIKAKILSKTQKILSINKKIILKEQKKGDLLSILPFGDDMIGVSTQGLKYALKGQKLSLDRSQGVSNIIESNTVTIQVLSGKGLIVIKRRLLQKFKKE